MTSSRPHSLLYPEPWPVKVTVVVDVGETSPLSPLCFQERKERCRTEATVITEVLQILISGRPFEGSEIERLVPSAATLRQRACAVVARPRVTAMSAPSNLSRSMM